jgi:hypothetical protein
MADIEFPMTKVEVPEANAPGQTPIVLQMLYLLDAAFAALVVVSRSTVTPPGSPAQGDAYLIPDSGATGAWVGHDDEIAVYFSGWTYVEAETYWLLRVADEGGAVYEWTGTAWAGIVSTSSKTAGITASTTQTQGQQPLTTRINQVSVVANANDAATLPAARAGLEVIVANDGANTLQLFPASGDSIDGGSVDASTTLATGKRALFVAYDATDWVVILGA